MRLPLAASMLLIATLTACGNDKSEPEATAPTTPAPSLSVSPSVTATTPTPTVPAFKVLPANALRGALIELNDVPPGFTQDPPETDASDKTFCDYKVPFKEQLQVERTFTNDADRQLIRSILRQYRNAAEAKASFDALVNAMKTCRSETYEGDRLNYSVMSAPKLGDGTIGIQIKVNGYALKQNFVLVGPVLAAIGGVGITAQQVADLVKLQFDRYTAAAKQ